MRRRSYFTFSMFRSARPNRKISTPEISFWMALAVETALGTMGTGFARIEFKAVEAAINAVAKRRSQPSMHHEGVAEREMQRLGAGACLGTQFFAEASSSLFRSGKLP